MAQKPSPWQQFVRGIIRESIEEINSTKPIKKKKKRTPKTPNRKPNRRIPTTTRVDILARDNYRCVFCGVSAKQAKLQIDHIIPVSKGGSNNPSNLQTLCWECNRT